MEIDSLPMAVGLAGGCRAFEWREGMPLARDGVRVWRHIGRERGADAISLSVLEIASGATASWCNGDSEEVLFVLAGDGAFLFDGLPQRIPLDTGILVRPGAGAVVVSDGREALLLASSRCPDPGRRIQFDDADSSRASCGTPPVIVRFEDQPIERAGDDRWFRVLVDAKTGSDRVTQFVGFIPPGRAPDHFHEYEEVVCILEGEGRFWSEDSSALVRRGWGLYLPRGRSHCLENTGTTPVKLYGLFYPAGSPAVRFRPDGPAR